MRKRKHVFALSCLILLGGLSLSVMTGCDDVDTKQSASISITESENGTVYASQTANLYEGDEVTLSIVPDDGYELETLLFNGEAVTVSGNKVTVTLVAGVNTVEATFVLTTTSSDDPVIDDDDPDIDDDPVIDDDDPDVDDDDPVIDDEDPDTGEDNPDVDDDDNPDIGGGTGGDEGEEEPDEPNPDPEPDPDTGDEPGTDPDPDSGDEGGEDNPGTGDDGQDNEENLFTLYVSVPEWWYTGNAYTYIFTYDENYTGLDTDYGHEMTYLENPGEYNGIKYYTYTIDLNEVTYIRLMRIGYNDEDELSFWQSETEQLEVTGDYNYFAMADDAKYKDSLDEYYGYAHGEWSNIELSDILREEATLKYDQSVTGGSISISQPNTLLLAGDEITVTITAEEGYVLDSFYFNGDPVTVPGTIATLTLTAGENTITYSFVEGEEDTTLTLYVSVPEWWYGSDALTYIFTYDENGDDIDTDYGNQMTYLENPGEYNGLKYYYYTIDLAEVSYIKLLKYGYSNGTDFEFWGAETELLEVTGDYNYFAMSDDAKYSNSSDPAWQGYATGSWGVLTLEDILRAEATLTYSASVTGGSISIDKTEGLLEGDEITVTINADEGYVIDTFKFNGRDVEVSGKYVYLTVQGGENTIEYSFTEGEAEYEYVTIYVYEPYWWHNDGGYTSLILYDENQNVIDSGEYGVGVPMNHVEYVGTDTEAYNIREYEIDIKTVYYVQLMRTDEGSQYDWGARSHILEALDGTTYNEYIIGSEMWWNGAYYTDVTFGYYTPSV